MTNNQLTKGELRVIADTDHVQCGDAAAMAKMLLEAMDADIDTLALDAATDIMEVIASSREVPLIGGDTQMLARIQCRIAEACRKTSSFRESGNSSTNNFREIPETSTKCNCHSYNKLSGNTPNVTLTVPENILAHTDGRKTVCVDACIAPVIGALWAQGLPTLNSCCGHNELPPSIVIPESEAPEKYIAALREADPQRVWIVSRWEMARVGYATREHDISLRTCTTSPEYVYTMQSMLTAAPQEVKP